MSERGDNVAAKFAELRRNYVRNLLESVAGIRYAWSGVAEGRDGAMEEMRRLVHRMNGSGGTFGFPEVSAAAAPLEALLDGLIAVPGSSPSADLRDQVAALMDNLDVTCREASPNESIHASGTPAIPGGEREPDGAILVLANSPALAQSIRATIIAAGLTVESIVELPALIARADASRPAAIVIEGVPTGSDPERPEMLARLANRLGRNCPIIFVSRDGDPATRLAAVRAGGAAFVTTPLDPSDLLDEIERHTHAREEAPFRVLVVDDEAALAEFYATILQQEGMTVRIATDALRSLVTLSELDPDLVLLDLYMPGCDGLTLAKIVRQQPRYHHIPLVFLSTEVSLDRQLRAQRFGGDDFLTKPILPNQLISAVTSRIERHRILRNLMERDALTGLLNHTAILGRLDAELTRALRGGSNLSVAMLDIDFFKRVNDTHGHPVGDQVLVALAKSLRRGVRRSDTVGRYGGEEFAVVLPECDAVKAAETIDRIRAAFAGLRHGSAASEFSATFSAGVASTSQGYDSPAALIEAADHALYAAKSAGRNCVTQAANSRSSDPVA